MTIIAVLITLFFFYKLFILFKNKKAYKEGGLVLRIFTQHSFMVRVLSVIMLLSIFFTVWTYNTFGIIALTNTPLLGYIMLMLYCHTRKIEVLQKGLYLNGRFFEWKMIEKVEVDSNKSLSLTLSGDRYKIYVVDKIEGVGMLVKSIKQEMHRKNK